MGRLMERYNLILSQNDPDNHDQAADQADAQVLTQPRTKRPTMYKVMLLNDDYTPMDFVVLVLKRFFKKNHEEANHIMLQVHHQGAGVAGIFTFEIAETKVFQVSQFARKHQHPLKCIMEQA